MALCSSTPFFLFLAPKFHCFSPAKTSKKQIGKPKKKGFSVNVINAEAADADDKPTKLITFLGKGGSGKTTTSIFAAQHYAMSGLNTCLVIHSQDPSAEYLLNCKIGSSPTKCNDNLSAVRLETTKMILEPLKKLKQADARLNLTQGVIEGVVGEELGVLPGMDSIFSALELERLVGFFGNMAQNNTEKFDIVIYDGISTEETIRMIGVVRKVRLYLKYLRQLAEKTDLGRVSGPSIFRLVDEAMSLSSIGININGKTSSEIWDYLERVIEKGSSVFAEPQKFGCYIVMDPANPLSVHSVSRYWGCAIQAGIELSGVFAITSVPDSPVTLLENVKTKFCPLPSAFIPYFRFNNHLNWNEILDDKNSQDARHMLSATSNESVSCSVKFDLSSKSVALFMPGFDKSEIKLYQFRGGSELLVEAGDQRRIIHLPSQIQGKVSGAKFANRSLIISMR